MSVIVPFAALRPQKQFVKEVASLPYDVVSTEEARAIGKAHPLSFLHVEKSEIDLPPHVPPHDQRIYDRARHNLETMVKEGVLFRDTKPCFYIYSQAMNGHRQYGIVACISVAEYETGKIKKHELTRTDKELDRIRHVDTVNAHTGPVFIAYEEQPAIDRLVEEAVKLPPEYDFLTEDGISHTVWTVADEDRIAAIIRGFKGLERLYIADGHHRAAAAAAVARLRREKAPDGRPAAFEYVLAVLFPQRQLKIMDYNRVVKDLNGLSLPDFLRLCRERFSFLPDYRTKSPAGAHEFGMYLDGRWYGLAARPGTYDESDPISRLDVSILQEQLLGSVLGVCDPRSDGRIEFVGGIRGVQELERLVDNRLFAVAFALYPVTIEDLIAVADADLIMPPKSTWFEPKLRSGVFIHLLE